MDPTTLTSPQGFTDALMAIAVQVLPYIGAAVGVGVMIYGLYWAVVLGKETFVLAGSDRGISDAPWDMDGDEWVDPDDVERWEAERRQDDWDDKADSATDTGGWGSGWDSDGDITREEQMKLWREENAEEDRS